MKRVLLMIIILFSCCVTFAKELPEGVIPLEEAGVSIVSPEDIQVQEIVIEDPYENMNTLEKAVANKTTVIWMIVGIVVFYLILVVVVLKLTKKRWK